MAIEFSAAVRRIPVYPAAAAYALPEDVALLASNESPEPPLEPVVAAVQAILTGVNRYPDPTNAKLRGALSDRYDVPASRIAIGNGSCDILLAAGEALLEPGAELVYAWPSFSVYPHLAAATGATQIQVPLNDAQEHDLEAMLTEITAATRLVIVCNPNNPTGTAVGSELAGFVDSIPDDVLVVVDEAYHHYTDPALIPDALVTFRDRPNVVVTRTFSKAFALAGLRVGYCIGAPEVVQAVRKTQIPFSVSGLAQQCAIAALGDEAVVRRRAVMTVGERERVTAVLRDAGYDVPASQANFVWLPIGEAAARFAQHCADSGVLVRPFAGDGVRVTTGLPEENDSFLALAQSWAAAHSA